MTGIVTLREPQGDNSLLDKRFFYEYTGISTRLM